MLSAVLVVVSCEPTHKHEKGKENDVEDGVKQRVVIEFLTKEKTSMDEIQNRLRSIYGEKTVDVNQVASPDEREAWILEKRLKERIVIQFLTSEQVYVKDIYERLSNVYGECTPYSSVQRWAKQFKDGRTSVANKPRSRF